MFIQDEFVPLPLLTLNAADTGDDGSEAGDKSFDTLAVIGKEAHTPPADIEAPAKRPELEKEAFWPVAISYFERGKKTDGEQTPDYQMSFDLYANGNAICRPTYPRPPA